MGELRESNLIILQIKSLDNIIGDHLTTLRQHEHSIKESKFKSNLIQETEAKMFLAKAQEIKTNEKVSVFIKVNFLRIGAIDTTHDRYSAEIMIHMRWREPLLDNEQTRARHGDDLARFWNPSASISNGIGELKYLTTSCLEIDKQGRAWIHENRKTTAGHFFEFMELYKFPFDTQDLTVTVTSEKVAEELEFIPYETSAVNAGAFSAAQEWQLNENVAVWTKLTVKTVNKQKVVHPCFCVAAKVARRPQFFIYNVIIIMFAICSLSFATFTVQLEKPEARLPLTFLLVLTTVTFKLVVNKSLPKISYLTYLDKYVLGSMVILCSICIWQSISGSLVNNWTQKFQSIQTQQVNMTSSWCPLITKPSSTELGRTIDFIMMGTLAFIYVAFHLAFLIVITLHKKGDISSEK